ncbi:MAG: LEPR-XLL domain-containing protein [Verrucomicrobia bacterium]|nr:LEPR-XLL domain-containing protein [Verrucomicrobiota bacterium]
MKGQTSKVVFEIEALEQRILLSCRSACLHGWLGTGFPLATRPDDPQGAAPAIRFSGAAISFENPTRFVF